ncbi:hypothetical protein [Criblamydia sequanensis]|uniref:Uncharacterized protein n=1 Tax=Candidatus Criblamydia sequanensis CRIB-18 TaxID=1437425 RepID=A0A090D0T9_9BACT|nr:hypothetical protein [Criblamydia sequanensis]CDR33193.1 hypothetical protein CSEC_0354 [Criblamydia sequanensis CRIB-18]
MNLAKYQSYFHDGTLIDIIHIKNTVEISISSCEIDLNDLERKIPLAHDGTIRGKIIVKKNIKVLIDKKNIPLNELRMFYDRAEILNLNVSKNEIKIFLLWKTLRPVVKDEKYSELKIEAEEIYFENIPTLLDPFEFTEPSLSEYATRSHYHQLNPEVSSKDNKYLDKEGNPTAQGSLASYLTDSIKIKSNDFSSNYNEKLPISKYEMEFHDGNLINIEHKDQNLTLTIISSELKTRIVDIDNIKVSFDNRIKGNLHFDEVTKILKWGKDFQGPLNMFSDFASIYYLKFYEGGVVLSVIWERYFPRFQELKNDKFQIEAKKIYWESLPNLED